ncbi:uncharacterized protein LOC110252162 isoform X2 [Exaiptasia diaphana]|nr:uncharacterized protein LOC110252162 isoform X2 [Exaiptasia diaphana]
MSYLVHFIVNIGGKSPFTNDNIQQIRRCIGKGLAIELIDVFFWSVDWLQSGCVDVTYALHTNEDKILQLQKDALNKKDWLTRLGVQILRVNEQSPIMITSKDKQVCMKQPCTLRPRQAVRSVLGNTCPDTILHSSEMVDIILAIEVPWSVNVHHCKAVADQCDEAINNFESNKRISLITYGHHSARKPSCTGLKFEHIALGGEDFHEGSLPITDTVTKRGQCGSQTLGNSGIADALRCAYGLANSVRPQATKVCILTCFLSDKSSNLEHYKCYHGIDPVKICHLLAESCASLYIVGIVTNEKDEHILRKENHFLSGITHITGGRYFEINDINRLRPVIEYILKETASIEKVMGTVNDIVIGEINAQYGDVNNVHLAEHLNDELHKRNVKVEKIKIHQGTPLKPISKLSERVAWANDLDDAIEGLKNMRITHNEPAEVQATQEIQVSHDDPDMEVSSRMVIRQLHRSAYSMNKSIQKVN